MTTVLQTESLTKAFGRLVAVDDVNVAIDSSEITSIIGPNGAGKTTFYNLLSGRYKPTEGEVLLRPRNGDDERVGADDGTDGTGATDSADATASTDATDGAPTSNDGGPTTGDGDDGLLTITGREPHEISRLGLSRGYQINNVFEGLSVIDNVRIARISRDKRTLDLFSQARKDQALTEEAWEVIELTRLEEVADEKCANLSHGDVRKVEIAIALATDPSVVLLDEPTAGMNASETRKMVDLVRRLDRETDTTFVLTEHDMEVVVGISDRILVLDNGALIAEGTPEEVMADERVKEAYLGEVDEQ